MSLAQSRLAFQQGLADTVAAYRRLGVRLHLVEQVPQQLRSPDISYHTAWAEPDTVQQRLDALAVPRPWHRELQGLTRLQIERLRGQGDVHLINLDDLFCTDRLCRIGTPATPYYQDISHLSDAGAALTIPLFTGILKERR